MILLLAALLVALAIYSNAEFFQNHFFSENYFSKIFIKKIRNFLPVSVYRSYVCIQGHTNGNFADPNYFKNTDSQSACHKENEFMSGFV